MDTVLSPASETEAAEAIRDAGAPLRIEGGGTRSGFGRPVEAASTLKTTRLAGITLHEPAELIISARGGTPVSAVEAQLAAKGQMLPFEPVDLRPLYGSVGEPTVGGLVAGNWSGPRRIAAGAVRDHVIGVRFVNGRGEVVKSGGRVMKNVTGLDLSKLMCGAQGTLGLLTEITFKVLPRPETAVTLAFSGLDDSRAVQAMTKALGSPFEVTGAAHLPAGVGATTARTLLRIEGFAVSVAYRSERLSELLASYGASERLEGEAAAALWRDIGDARPLAEPVRDVVWRLSVAPTRGPSLADLIVRTLPARFFFDWGGGLIWLATVPEGDAGAGAIRAAVAVTGGHATLVRGPAALRAGTEVFQPLAAPLATITAGLKTSFDPGHILNPGRMYAGC